MGLLALRVGLVGPMVGLLASGLHDWACYLLASVVGLLALGVGLLA